MNRGMIIAFVVGALVSSAGWFAYTKHLQAKQALEVCALYSHEIDLADALMARSQDPSDEAIRKTRQSAITIAQGWIDYVDQTEKNYPWVKAKERLATEYKQAEALLQEWKNTTSNHVPQDTARKLADPEH